MKSILFYYKLFFAGGIESSILKLVRKLYRDYNIFVAYDDENSHNTVLDRISEYAEIINLNKTDSIKVDTCIWCSHPKQWTFKEFTNKVQADKFYCWGHILLFDTYPDLSFDDEFIKNMDKFINVSKTVEDDLLNKYPELENKSMVLENYMDIDEIIKKSNDKIQIKVQKNKINIITTARIAHDKGYKRIKTLCDVFNSNNIEYDWYILGKAFKKEVYDEITDMFKDNKNVHFLGYQNNVYPFIKQMDYMAILSDREANNLSITEALSVGIPCLVSAFKGVTNQIQDKENGIILDLDNTYENYENRLDDIVKLKNKLKLNVQKKDYSKEYVLDIWKKIL